MTAGRPESADDTRGGNIGGDASDNSGGDAGAGEEDDQAGMVGDALPRTGGAPLWLIPVGLLYIGFGTALVWPTNQAVIS